MERPEPRVRLCGEIWAYDYDLDTGAVSNTSAILKSP